jgi:XTP/dITP diphosphohydrolase
VILLLATTNPDKLREIVSVLGDLPIELKTLKEFPAIETPQETGSTFAENAREKALYYANTTGLLTMAEDSGFELDALDGAPGIYSARYLRPDATYTERFAALYEQLTARGSTTRTARFVSALALASGGNIVFETTGVVEGELAAEPAGGGGFGYDPIFRYPPYGKTFGEVAAEQKLAVSHRGHALRAMRTHLERQL